MLYYKTNKSIDLNDTVRQRDIYHLLICSSVSHTVLTEPGKREASPSEPSTCVQGLSYVNLQLLPPGALQQEDGVECRTWSGRKQLKSCAKCLSYKYSLAISLEIRFCEVTLYKGTLCSSSKLQDLLT